MGDISNGTSRQNNVLNIPPGRGLEVGNGNLWVPLPVEGALNNNVVLHNGGVTALQNHLALQNQAAAYYADRSSAFKEYVRPNGAPGMTQMPMDLAAAAAAAAAAASPQLLLAQLAGIPPNNPLGATTSLSSQHILQQLQQQAFAQAYAQSLAQLQRAEVNGFIGAPEVVQPASAALPLVLSAINPQFAPPLQTSAPMAGAIAYPAPVVLPFATTSGLAFPAASALSLPAPIPFETPALISLSSELLKDSASSKGQETGQRETEPAVKREAPAAHQTTEIACQASACSSESSGYNSSADSAESGSRSGCEDKPEDTMEVISVTKTEKACQAAFDPAGNEVAKHHHTSKTGKRKHAVLSNSDDGTDSNGGSKSGKKTRLIWTPELHARFLNAVNHLGVKNAVPKTILQLMNVEGMTRENVASHLQKYRLYLKRLAGLPSNAPLSAETLQTVQNVQHAMQHQVQVGLQAGLHQQGAAAAAAAAALPLGGMPPASNGAGQLPPGVPQITVANNYEVLVNQLSAMNAATNGQALSAAAAAASLQASALSAMQRSAAAVAAAGNHSNGMAPPNLNSLAALNPLSNLNGIGTLANLNNNIGAVNTGLQGVLPVGLLPQMHQAGGLGGFGGMAPNVLGQMLSSMNGMLPPLPNGQMYSHQIPTSGAPSIL